MDESGIATGEEQENEQGQRRPGDVWLERSGPWKLAAGNALLLHSIVESQIHRADGDPVDEGGDGDEILQPAEDVAGAIGQSQVAEAHEQTQQRGGGIGNAHAVGAREDLGRVSFHGHAVENTRAAEHT